VTEEPEGEELTWEASYAIALRLIETYPDVSVEAVGYEQLVRWIVALPGFADDPALVNQGILDAILREWFEEVSDTQ
jgi:FeS assembly protein IscX